MAAATRLGTCRAARFWLSAGTVRRSGLRAGWRRPLLSGPRRNVGNAPHVLPLGSRTPDGFVINANLSRDLPI
jgi:hypothetical protein